MATSQKVMPSKGKGKGPMNWDDTMGGKGKGSTGGFSDEPPTMIAGMGKGPSFMGKGPMPDFEIDIATEDMPEKPEMPEMPEMNPLAAVQAQIATISDIEGVKVTHSLKAFLDYFPIFRVSSMQLFK